MRTQGVYRIVILDAAEDAHMPHRHFRHAAAEMIATKKRPKHDDAEAPILDFAFLLRAARPCTSACADKPSNARVTQQQPQCLPIPRPPRLDFDGRYRQRRCAPSWLELTRAADALRVMGAISCIVAISAIDIDTPFSR